jgi:radical SAM superfamily enzyme YgiQ (UPF0313 family)
LRILLIKPPKNPHVFSPSRTEPLELEYLAAAVPQHAVEILDMRIDQDLMKKLERHKPHVVGLTAYTCDVNKARIILREVKKFNKNIITAVGGHHATFMPFDFASSSVDVVFLGMSDLSFKNYIHALAGKGDVGAVENIALVKDGTLFFTAKKTKDIDLDSLPFPARHLTRAYRIRYRDAMQNPLLSLLTSRGCPFRCTFCACWKFMDGKYLTRNAESVVEEIRCSSEDVEMISFDDDNTLHDVRRARLLCDLLKQSRIRKKLSMYARADDVVKHPDLIENLRDVGLECLTLGIESFRDDDLHQFNKKTSVLINNEAIRILHKLGVHISAHFIVSPDYTAEDFERLFRYVCDQNLFRLAFPILTPFPGTGLYADHHDHFAIRNYDFFDAAHSILFTKLERAEFYRRYADLYRKGYSFGRFFRAKWKEIVSFFGASKVLSEEFCDKISFLGLGFAHIYGWPRYWKMRNNHKSEPHTPAY